MDHDDQPSPAVLRQMVIGYWASQAIYVVAKLGVADALADGPKTSKELADSTQAHASTLHRVLRALAGLGLFREDRDGRFALTPLGAYLRTDVGGSVRSLVSLMGEPWFWRPWGELLHGVQTGTPPFAELYGVDLFAYCAQHPDAGALYDSAMMNAATMRATSVVAAYDFSSARTVVDVGGGQGRLLATVLVAHPGMHGRGNEASAHRAGDPRWK